jgi:hypothetical protein
MPAAFSQTKRSRYGRGGFTPWRPPKNPPVGTYDPALDQGRRAAGRGLQDLTQDIGYDPVTGAPTGTQSTRALHDYLLAGNRIDQTQSTTLADILRNQTRSGEDYGTATQNLGRQYANLASSQRQAANAAGVLNTSGWDSQAAGKRGANQALEQGVLDTANRRQTEDFGTARDQTNVLADQQRGDLGLGYQRGTEDRQTELTRATRENDFYGADTRESAWYQARAAGYVPPTRPANEHHVGNVTWRDLGHGRTVSADGTVRSQSDLRRLLRQRGLRR